MENNTPNETKSPCVDCPKGGEFSFEGCAKSCLEMFEHLKKIFTQDCSPCLNLRCGMPGANEKQIGICAECRIRETYVSRIGDGPRSVSWKPVTPFVTEWDIKHNKKY